MIETVIKRDGSQEPYNSSKLNHWAQWAITEEIQDRVDWGSVVLDTYRNCPAVSSSQDINKELIKQCLERNSAAYDIMAGSIYIAMMYKKLYPDGTPTVKELHEKLLCIGLMRKLDYTEQEYEYCQSLMDHSRDFGMSYSAIDATITRFALQDRTGNVQYEMPQFTYMRMAMALAEGMDKSTRMEHILGWYTHYSLRRISAPSPNFTNLATPQTGTASCCAYAANDTGASLAAADHITYAMTLASAGLGVTLDTRSIGDPVRGGMTIHQGKLPYFSSHAESAKANRQTGRGGAITGYYSCFDPEAKTITILQNPKTPLNLQNRKMHFAFMNNRFFAMKVALNEDVFMFTSWTAPDLYEALFDADQDKFERLYNNYEKNLAFEKKYISARKLLLLVGGERFNVSSLYMFMVDEVNRHTPHRSPIRSSNLCTEIMNPTAAYASTAQLYNPGMTGSITLQVKWLNDRPGSYHNEMVVKNGSLVTIQRGQQWFNNVEIYWTQEGDFVHFLSNSFMVEKVVKKDPEPETMICTLGGVVVDNVFNGKLTQEQIREVYYYVALTADRCIDISDFGLPHLTYTSKNRRNIGVGVVGLATWMARKNLKYASTEGRAAMHELAEAHSYWMIRAGLDLGKKYGNAPWMIDTKWPQGWLPIDTYKKTVDEITPPDYKFDWEALRSEIIKNGGIRFSTLVSHMPTETSSKAVGKPNSLYKIRKVVQTKSGDGTIARFVAPDSDLIGHQYDLAYEGDPVEDVKNFAIWQKFADGGISMDTYADRSVNPTIYTSRIIKEYLAMIKYGIKSAYYADSLVASGTKHEDMLVEFEETADMINEATGGGFGKAMLEPGESTQKALEPRCVGDMCTL